ncbi:class I SAM-dependent methyltransferase [Novosphingobium sp. BL-8A]|uniref:class I SAM-dependent methyltransferase n=1 Tax=Novosphingobium sp. BL-8A TaxID=3127639 RepID=UPI00375821EE
MDSETRQSAAHWDQMYAAARGATWHTDETISAYIEQRQFGKQGHWLGHIFQDVVKFRPKRLLSIGCGAGDHELAIARAGLAEEVHAFDASEVGIAQAQQTALAENLNANFFVDTFETFIDREFPQKFDTIMFVGSLHHVENMNDMLAKVSSLLTDDGKVMYNEYIGPCYISFPDERVALINHVLRSIPAEFKVSPDAQWRNPTMQEIQKLDPSEAVRSALIPQFLRLYFDVEWERGFGGGLLHPLFQQLNVNRLAVGDAASDAVVSMLIGIEQLLEDQAILPCDFVLGIACQKANAA